MERRLPRTTAYFLAILGIACLIFLPVVYWNISRYMRIRELRESVWLTILSETQPFSSTFDGIISNRTLLSLELYVDGRLYAVVPVVSALEVDSNSSGLTIPIYIMFLNYSAPQVYAVSWWNFNISQFLSNIDYSNYPEITDIGRPMMNIKYRDKNLRNDGIYHGEDILAYLSVGPGIDLPYHKARIEDISWVAAYVSIKDPKITLTSGDEILYSTAFTLKFIYLRRGEKWISRLYLDVESIGENMGIELWRRGELYHLKINIKTRLVEKNTIEEPQSIHGVPQ